MAKKRKIYDIITIGGATRDIIFYTDEGELVTGKNLAKKRLLGFEFGGKVNLEEVKMTFGGGAANSAAAFARLGLRTAANIAIGSDDNGRAILDNLKKNKIDAGLVEIKKGEPTGFSFILTDLKSKEHIAFLYRGANNQLEFSPAKLRGVKNKWFYITSLPGKNWERILTKALTVVRKSREPKINVSWNPGAKQIKLGLRRLAGILKSIDVLQVNRDEALDLVSSVTKLTRKIDQPEVLVKILKRYGPKIVVVTDGAKGAYVSDGRAFYHAKTLNFKPVDTTGVGDAFGASFIAGLILYRDDIVKALKLAVVNSSFELLQVGAETGLLTRKEAEKQINKVKITKII